MELRKAKEKCRTMIKFLRNCIPEEEPDNIDIAEAIETVLQTLENSIPKEVVEKKIGKLEEDGYWDFLEKRDLQKTIEILQELLEGE